MEFKNRTLFRCFYSAYVMFSIVPSKKIMH